MFTAPTLDLRTTHDADGGHSSQQTTTTMDTDQALVAALRRGEPGAAEALYRKVSPAVNRALRQVFQGQDRDQDDLVQITFERLIRTLIEGRFAFGCSLNTWASSIANHTALDNFRARTRERKVFARSTDDASPRATDLHSGERTLRARAEVREVQGILSRMKPEQAEALLLYHVDGLSVMEMAAHLGISETAAQARLARGRKELLKRAGPRLGRTTRPPEP